MEPAQTPYRFGKFLFDPASGELKDLEAGSPVVRLQPQVASLLTALVERPGTVISRAELQARLWPDTTVDFDDGLNFCVRQLRLALSDDASKPRYVETLARRGYRFIAAVNVGPDAPVERKPIPIWQRPIVISSTILALIAVLWFATAKKPVRTGFKLAVVPFLADTTDSLMTAYRQQLFRQVSGDVGGRSEWDVVADTNAATHVLSGALKRRGFSVEVFVQLVRRSNRRHLWADSILDSYAFSGNSTLTADRIARSVSRLLQSDTTATARP